LSIDEKQAEKISGKTRNERFELRKSFTGQLVTGEWSVNFPLHNPSLFEHFEMMAHRDYHMQDLVEKLKLPHNLVS